MHDDFISWLLNHGICIKAWASIKHLAKIMGLGLNNALTGAVRMLRDSNEPDELVQFYVGREVPRG